MIGAVLAVAILLSADALRRVFAVGREANDLFVAALVLGCVAFYAAQALAGPRWAAPLFLYGIVGIWGLFFCIHGHEPPSRPARWLLGYPSQLAYAYALWGGLLLLLRAPWAWLVDAPILWAGWWNLLPLGLALGGCLHTFVAANRVTRHLLDALPAPLAQLSDLHASPLMHRGELDPLVAAINQEDPAFVVVTGDLVMPFSEDRHDYMLDALAQLRAPVFACAGNHDLPVLDRLRAGMASRGLRMLVDEAVVIEQGGRRIEIVGVAFHWRDARAHFLRALDQLPESTADFRILLAHDPRLGAWVPPGRFELVLSGHTHGGHVAANWLGVAASALRLLRLRDQGWFDQRRHYVHRGNWLTGLPPRMGVSGEIALFVPGACAPGAQSRSSTTGA